MPGKVVLGLNAANYFQGYCPFLNWWKAATTRSFSTTGGTVTEQAAWDDGSYLTSDGELQNPAPAVLNSMQRLCFQWQNTPQIAAGCDYAGEQWVLSWTGTSASADISVGGTALSSKVVGANSIEFTTASGTTSLNVILPVSNKNDPPRNIKLYQKRYESYVQAGKILNPDWLNLVKDFGYWRFMDLMKTNGSGSSQTTVSDISHMADLNYQAWGSARINTATNGSFGPKGSMHPEIICAMIAEAGTEVRPYICIPHQATDQCIIDIATYMKANCTNVVAYTLSNEHWNGQFPQNSYMATQGNAIWPADGNRATKWYGYRSAQMMKLVRDVYNDRTRWEGILETQSAVSTVTTNILVGVDYWRANVLSPANSLVASDLFNAVAVTGYVGDAVSSKKPTAITQANPGVVTLNGHGFTYGQTIKSFNDTGMVELNNQKLTVTVVDANNFSIGVDTTGYTAFGTNSDNRQYMIDSRLFDLMDMSNSLHGSDPANYPTKYTYFNRTVADSHRLGTTVNGYTAPLPLTFYSGTAWPAHYTIASGRGLELRQYEGNSHFVGDAFLSGFNGNTQWTEYIEQYGYSSELAEVMAAMYANFKRIGGTYPSKFTEAGSIGPAGTWSGMRFFPLSGNGNTDDSNNPVWQVTALANAGKRVMTLKT